jgi:hypothetical protein
MSWFHPVETFKKNSSIASQIDYFLIFPTIINRVCINSACTQLNCIILILLSLVVRASCPRDLYKLNKQQLILLFHVEKNTDYFLINRLSYHKNICTVFNFLFNKTYSDINLSVKVLILIEFLNLSLYNCLILKMTRLVR